MTGTGFLFLEKRRIPFFLRAHDRDDSDEGGGGGRARAKGVFLHSGWYMISHEQFAKVDEAIYI